VLRDDVADHALKSCRLLFGSIELSSRWSLEVDHEIGGRERGEAPGFERSRDYHPDRTAKSRFIDHVSSHRPLIHELVQTYGTTWKALIEEEFGDGIMSAIDFEMQIEREPNPKGDRVRVSMSGKFLPYKRY
jgi:hypothetical protein